MNQWTQEPKGYEGDDYGDEQLGPVDSIMFGRYIGASIRQALNASDDGLINYPLLDEHIVQYEYYKDNIVNVDGCDGISAPFDLTVYDAHDFLQSDLRTPFIESPQEINEVDALR